MQNISNDRIAYLEAKRESDHSDIMEIKETLHSLDKKVGKIELRLEKSMSFFGGIAFAFSLVGGAFGFIIAAFAKKMGVLG